MVGELHAHLRSNDTAARATATTRLVRELLTDQRFRYFGNEWFQNAGPIKHAVRDYWVRTALGPAFDPAAPGAAAMDDQHVGARVTPSPIHLCSTTCGPGRATCCPSARA